MPRSSILAYEAALPLDDALDEAEGTALALSFSPPSFFSGPHRFGSDEEAAEAWCIRPSSKPDKRPATVPDGTAGDRGCPR